MTPVASPALLAGRTITDAAELLELPLIHFTDSEDWTQWFHEAGISFEGGQRELRFDSHALVLAAAKAGLGVALARTPFVSADLADGQLLRLFPISIPSPETWYVILPRSLKHERVAPVRDWLLEEGRATN